MANKKIQEAKRKEVWASTKSAVRAYAHNPCEATMRGVETAIEEVKRQSLEAPRERKSLAP